MKQIITFFLVLFLTILTVTAADRLKNWRSDYNAEIARAERAGEIKTEAQIDALLTAAIASEKTKDVITYLGAKDKREKKMKSTKKEKKSKKDN